MTQSKVAQESGSIVGTTVEFNDLALPGAYVTDQGSLIRVEPEALVEGHSLTIRVESKDITMLMGIADDHAIPIQDARVIAERLDLTVNF